MKKNVKKSQTILRPDSMLRQQQRTSVQNMNRSKRNEMKTFRRAGEIAKATGLKTAVIGRLADRGIIPFLRADNKGYRYFDLDEVVSALGLPQVGQGEEDHQPRCRCRRMAGEEDEREGGA
jgi:hypothetical protein